MAQGPLSIVMETAPEALTAPRQGVAQGALVLTMEGALPVEYLAPGDRLITRNGARRLRQIEVTRLQNARLILIGAETLGDRQPEAPMAVPATQPILVRDWRAKALCGTPAALIPAARLADGEFIRAVVLDEVRLYTLAFDAAEVISANGIEIACAPLHVPA